MGNSLRIRRTGNIRRVWQRPKCRYIGNLKIRVMAKLDESKVRYILRKSRNDADTSKIAKEMHVSARWIRKLCARYRNVEPKDVKYPMRMGRPSGGMPGRRRHLTILTYRQAAYLGATGLEKVIENATGIHMPHNTIHDVLKDEKMANIESKNSRKRKWV